MGGSSEIGKIVHFRARDSHRALHHLAFRLNTPPDECGIHAVKSQATNPQGPAISFKQSRDPCCVVAAGLGETCADHAVPSPQPPDRDLGSGPPPVLSARRTILSPADNDPTR